MMEVDEIPQPSTSLQDVPMPDSQPDPTIPPANGTCSIDILPSDVLEDIFRIVVAEQDPWPYVPYTNPDWFEPPTYPPPTSSLQPDQGKLLGAGPATNPSTPFQSSLSFIPSIEIGHPNPVALEAFERGKKPYLAPMWLSHTCQKWRDVAIHSGYLWTTVIADFPTSPSGGGVADASNPDALEGSPALVDMWLTRGKTLPVDLYLRQYAAEIEPNPDDKDKKPSKSVFVTVVERLIRDVTRWRSVKIYLSPGLVRLFVEALWETTTRFMNSTNGPFAGPCPRLEAVKMASNALDGGPDPQAVENMSAPWWTKVVQLFYTSPALQQLDFKHRGSGRRLLPSPRVHPWETTAATWDNLRSLKITSFSIDHNTFLADLRSAARLEDIEMHDVFVADPPFGVAAVTTTGDGVQGTSKIVLLPSLRRIHIAESAEPYSIFHQLKAPNLETVELVHCDHERTATAFQMIEDVIARSGCHLKKIVYHDMLRDNEDVFMRYLASPAFNHLIRVDLQGGITDDLLTLLTVPSPSGLDILPCLTSLRLSVCAPRAAGCVKKMAASRFRGTATIARLRELELGMSRPHVHARDIGALLALEKKGLKFTYKLSYN